MNFCDVREKITLNVAFLSILLQIHQLFPKLGGTLEKDAVDIQSLCCCHVVGVVVDEDGLFCFEVETL